MKGKNIIITALAVTVLIACKDKTYKPPTLDAMRSADKARAAWAREIEEHSATVETQISRMDFTAKIVYQPFMAKKTTRPLIKRMTSNHPV